MSLLIWTRHVWISALRLPRIIDAKKRDGQEGKERGKGAHPVIALKNG
jgi:hypothetical protein